MDGYDMSHLATVLQSIAIIILAINEVRMARQILRLEEELLIIKRQWQQSLKE